MNVDASACVSRHFSGMPLADIEIQKASAGRMFKDAGIPEDRVEIKEAWSTSNVDKPIMAERRIGNNRDRHFILDADYLLM